MNTPQSHSSFLSWPHTKAGVFGVALTALFLVVTGLNLWTTSADQRNALLVFATFLAALGAVAGLILSTIAILRQHERSLLVYLSLLVGVAVVAFLAVETLTGHD
jgi:Ni,Fe-hydrogenase I cytochrome b subunit